MSVFASMNVKSMSTQEAQFWLCLNNLAYIFDATRNPNRCAKLSDADYIYHATKILATTPCILKQENFDLCRTYILGILSESAFTYLNNFQYNLIDSRLPQFTFEENPKETQARRTRSQTKQWRSIIDSRNQERASYTQKCEQSRNYLETFLRKVCV